MALWRSQGSTPASLGWGRSSRDVNSIGGTGYTGILLFPKIQGGVGVSDTVGWIWCPPAQSSSFSSAEGCLWERRLYRVRAVWIQTRSYGWKGPARLPVISEDQKLILDLPRDSRAIFIWLLEDLLPPALPLSAKGYRRSLLPPTNPPPSPPS